MAIRHAQRHAYPDSGKQTLVAWEQLELQVCMEFESLQIVQQLDREYAEKLYFLACDRSRGAWKWGDGSARERAADIRRWARLCEADARRLRAKGSATAIHGSCACGAPIKRRGTNACTPCNIDRRRALAKERWNLSSKRAA